jgi:hypothetical protein
MTSKPPPRHKPREEWSPDEISHHDRTGEPPETAEFRSYVRRVHEDAGLDPPEAEPEPRPLDALTAEDHFQQIRRGG